MALTFEEDELLKALGGGDIAVDSGSLSSGDLLSALNGGGSSSSLGASYDAFLSSQGAALSEYLPKLGVPVPEFVQEYAGDIRKEGEEALASYTPEYEGGILDQDLTDIPGFLGEKVAEGATQNIITTGGTLLAVSLIAAGGPITIPIGLVVAGIAGLSTYNAMLDEAIKTHADVAGKRPEDFTNKELSNAAITGLENLALDFINPVSWAKALKSANLPKNTTPKDIAKRLSETEKEKFGTVLYRASKESLKGAAREGVTEGLQYSNIMRTSEAGLEGIDAGELLTNITVGAASGGVFGSPFAGRIANAPNRQRRADIRTLKGENVSRLQGAADEYESNVEDSEAAWAIIGRRGTVPETADVVPDLFDVPNEKTMFQNIRSAAYDLLLNRSVDAVGLYDNLKTGKDYSNVRKATNMFIGSETGSGVFQADAAFEEIKHKLNGDFVNKFENIRDRWARNIPLFGQMGSTIRDALNAYAGAAIENRAERVEMRAALVKQIGAKKVSELDKDIITIKKLQDRLFKDLRNTLGKDGLSLNYVQDYLTRGVNYRSIKKNPDGFLRSLIEDMNVDPKDAQIILNNVLNDVDPSVVTSEQIRFIERTKGLGKASFEKKRQANWENLSSEFRNTNTFESIENYLINATTRLASAQAFGGKNANKLSKILNELNESGAITTEQSQSMWDLYDAYHHVYKKPKDAKGRARIAAFKAASTVTAVSFLGLATISSWTEPAWIPQRVGWVNMLKATPTIASFVMKGIVRSLYGGGEGRRPLSSFGRDLLRVMGFATNPVMAEKVDKLMAGDRNVILSYYFRSPAALFLTQYTNFVRVWTATAGLSMIQNQANKLSKMKGNKLELLKRELAENGMTVADFKKMILNGNGKIDILNDAFLDSTFTNSRGNVIKVRDLLVPWMRKITTDVALEPLAGNRPLWMSDPNMMLISQLKSFPILFGNTIARRINRKMNPNECTPDFMGKMGTLSAVATAFALAGLAMAVKDAIRGVEKERGPLDYIGAIGVPLIDTPSVAGYGIGPAAGLVDNFARSAFGSENPLGDTAEEIFEILLKATVGVIGTEAILPD